MSNFESGSYIPEENNSSPDRVSHIIDEVFDDSTEESETMDLGIVYVAGTQRPATVVFPDPDGQVRSSSVQIRKTISPYSGPEYEYRSGDITRDATPAEIDEFERIAAQGSQSISENEPRLENPGIQTMRLGEYIVTSPMYPTEGHYPLVENLRTGARIGYTGFFKRQIDFEELPPRILVGQRNEVERENAQRLSYARSRLDWDNMVTVPRSRPGDSGYNEYMSDESIAERLNSYEEIEVRRNNNNYHHYTDALWYEAWASGGIGVSDDGRVANGRVATGNDYGEYMRVVRAAGLEDHLP